MKGGIKMVKYKIAFIDDEDTNIRSYKRKSHDVFDVVDIKLHTELDDTISEIIDNKIHAVIIDFDLTKKSDINYSGADIVELCPTFDNGSTAAIAARLMSAIIAMNQK